MNEDKVVNKVQPSEVKAGDIMAFHYYVKVENVRMDKGEVQLVVQDIENDQKFTVTGAPVIEAGFSGNWYEEENVLSRSKIIDILKISPNRPIQMKFTKKDGTKRVMTFRFLNTNDTGYAQVEELTDTGPKFKQADLRTFEWLIVDGTKYIVK